MAFPTIPTAGRVLFNTQANNSSTRTFSSLSGLTKNSGDLLIAIVVGYQSAASAGAVFSNWSAGWTEFLDVGGPTNMCIGAAYKYSTGSETGTFSVDQAGAVTGHAAMIVLSIPGANQSIIPVGGTIVTGTTTAANIAALNPSTWGTLDTLWIAVAGSGEVTTTGSFTGVGALPTNYTDVVFSGISGDVVGGVEAAVGFRQLNAASEDPGAFTVDTSNARNAAVLIAVCPAATAVTITHAQDTNIATALSGTTITRNITAATETDAVGEIVPLQTLPALETDSSQQLSTQSGHAITTATTTDSAQALNVDKTVTITLASETDVALSFGGQVLTLAGETDSAQPLSFGTYELTPATETDLAGEIVELQPLPALETDSPQVLAFVQSELFVTQVTETDSAQVISYTQGGGYAVAPATETDLANTIVALQPLPATETTTALALEVIYGGKNISPVFETDVARSIAPGTGITLPQYEVTAPLPYNSMAVTIGDRATAVALSITMGVGGNKSILPATETDSAGGGGPELLPNPGFEDSPGDAHWDTYGTMSMQPRLYGATTYPVPVLSGSYVLQVEANAVNDAIITEPDEWIAVTPGATYTLEAWFWSPVSMAPAIGVNPYTASLGLTGSSALQTTIPANTWTKLSHTFTLSSTAVWVQVSLYLWANAPKEFYIDSVSLKVAGGGPLTVSKQVPLPMVSSTASAQALTTQKTYSITTATSTAAAQNLTFVLDTGTFYSIDAAVSTDTALALSIFKQIFMTLGIVTELDRARLTRAANNPSGGLALIDHEPDSGDLILTDFTETEDLFFIDV